MFSTIAIGEDIPRQWSVRTPTTELDFSWSCFHHGRCPHRPECHDIWI